MAGARPEHRRIVVVGGGQAGLSACETLRKRGHQGPVTLVCEEPGLPYQRPPLSKAFLAGSFERERLTLKPAEFYRTQDIDVRTGVRCTEIDRAAREAALDSGDRAPYDCLAVTTGSRPRPLPAAVPAAPPPMLLRTLADADGIRRRLAGIRHLLVIGGGYIGLEIAASARKLGLEVTLVEAAPRLLARVAGPETAAWIHDLHLGNGVALRVSASLERLETRREGGIRARFEDGHSIDAGLAVAGVGAEPNVELARAAGLAVGNGIEVDEFCRTSDRNIFAAGDCASFPFRGSAIRLESVQNAIDQGATAAANMLDAELPYRPVPWFWSDQYDSRLQIAGLSEGADAVILRRGKRPGAGSVWYFAGEQLLAVDAIDDSRSYMIGRRLLASGKSPSPAAVANPGADLRPLLR